MPASILIPVGLAIAGMVASNVEQKSANANNQNQQKASVQNAKSAWSNAAQQMSPNTQPVNYSGLTGPTAPAPNIGLGKPATAGASNAQPASSASSILAMLQSPQLQSNPQVQAAISQILGQGAA